MRTIRRSASPLDHLSEAARAFFARRALELTGLSLVALAGGLTVALATWSVADPSLNHATDAPVRNLLGSPGAIAADLAMQLFGLGSLALVVPLALWGWRLLLRRSLGRLPLRLALWVVGAGASTAVASALPPTARWPLPTGLGGVTGDALLRAAKALTGLTGGAAST
jgi:S-DNA-T family DNA segregation ATPase FtsK/SpoIIIE